MKNTVLHALKKVFYCLIGGGMTLNAAVLLLISNVDVGIIVTLLMGLIFLFLGIFEDHAAIRLPMWLKRAWLAAVAVWFLFAAVLWGYGTAENVTYEEDAVIVLGTGIHGEELGETLRGRLDCALEYHQKNPDAVIVVSGGQGLQEDIPEGLAMERYLISRGVPQECIIKEDQATSTYENFTYSIDLLEEHFQAPYETAFISNDFHVYRAASIAKQAGCKNITHLRSITPWYDLLPSTLRECLAVVKFWIFRR